jgi:hypothetical protein
MLIHEVRQREIYIAYIFLCCLRNRYMDNLVSYGYKKKQYNLINKNILAQLYHKKKTKN